MRAWGLLVGIAALLFCAAAPPALAAPPPALQARYLQQISSGNPFGFPCGVSIPPPLPGSKFKPKDTANEPHEAVNPRDPRNLISAWIQDFGVTQVTAVTKDGGRTWRRTVPPRIGKCNGGRYGAPGDPWVSFGQDGTAYQLTMGSDVHLGDTNPTDAILFFRSTDGGSTWSDPVEIEGPTGYNDHPALTVDRDDERHLYAVWVKRNLLFGTNIEGTYLSESRDGGRTWSPKRLILRPPRAFVFFSGSQLLTASDGSLLLTFSESNSETRIGLPGPPKRMQVLRSTDHGVHWRGPVTAGTRPEGASAEAAEDPDDGHPIEGDNSPSPAVGPEGWVYLTWSRREGTGQGHVVFVRSHDNGVTWSAPRDIAAPRAQAILPTVAVAGNGQIGVHWFDFRGDRRGDSALTTDVFFAHSRDHGDSWSQRHLAGPFDMRTAWEDPRSPTPGYFLGDFIAGVGLPDGFLPVFPMARPVASRGKSQIFAVRLAPPERSCLPARAAVRPDRIGRLRLGYTRPTALRRVRPRPTRRTRRVLDWCVRRSTGRLTAVFGAGRARLLAATAGGYGARGVHPGSRLARLRRAFPARMRVRRGLYRSGTRLFGVSRGRVRFLALATPRLLHRPRELRRYLALSAP